MRGVLPLVIALLLAALPQAVSAQTDAGSIMGVVVESDTGSPIPGVDVWAEGTSHHDLTDRSGRFALTGVPAGTYTVRASLIGYGTAEARVTVLAGSEEDVTFELSTQAIELDQLVATGYGQSSRRQLTGAVSSISGEEMTLKGAPTVTLSGALQGKAAGVQVVRASGFPGSGESVRVRGTNSITANSEPLYVIDGVPVTQGTSSSDPTQNPLVGVNPNDIESVEILKDASATAIYGARGANGVVLVTTRSGGERGNVVTFESSYGLQTIAKDIDVLNARQYRELRNEAMVNVGQVPQYSEEEVTQASTTDYP
ncbi:MAG: carboxypeptidase-like regulatory domain-containing protein, partial [Halobacteriales archaeon]|nr:carboxypeptidase-like regulatory domain-containing protein [Halobacteriales archaeon]